MVSLVINGVCLNWGLFHLGQKRKDEENVENRRMEEDGMKGAN